MDNVSVISFDEFEIDTGRGELRRSGKVVPLEPQVLDLIAYLATHPGVVLSREDLMNTVWNGRIVSDSAISSRINAARTALGDNGTAQRFIKTIPRRGFRFEHDERDYARRGGHPVKTSKPSIAVLPFENLSGDAEQRYFSDGITDDIITELSRYHELFVIARHSSFAYRDTSAPMSAIAGELGVQYIAEGSVRRAGDRIRVSAQLIDPNSGEQLWAERYDRDVTDIFEVQDEITTVIVNTMVGQIARLHHRRMIGKAPASVNAYFHVLKATEHALRVAPIDNEVAKTETDAAIAIDPGFARAHAIRALCFTNEGNNFWVADQTRSQQTAHQAALAAIAADARDPWGHAMLGIAELWLNKDHAAALQSMQRGIELNPSNAYFRGLYSYVLAFSGAADTALEQIDIAIRMNPIAPAVFLGFRGRALLMQRNLHEAIPILRQMVTEMPGHSNALGYFAAALVHGERLENARAIVAQLVRSNEHYRLTALESHLPFRDADAKAYIVDALERAGLPKS